MEIVKFYDLYRTETWLCYDFVRNYTKKVKS